MTPELVQLVDAYNSSANLVGFYWHFYAVVAFGLVGYVLGGDRQIRPELRWTLLVGFWFFAFASLGALLNKHGLHYAFANEITGNLASSDISDNLKEKLTVCEGIWKFLPAKCLHATNPWASGVMHLFIDIMVTGVILLGRRRENTD